MMNDKWLGEFYRECGREVTLAYTTLNQMKNWAMVVIAAYFSTVCSLFLKQDNSGDLIGVVVGAVIAFVFTLRFYFRSIICYINLVRWNILQRDIISIKIDAPAPDTTVQKKINIDFLRWNSAQLNVMSDKSSSGVESDKSDVKFKNDFENYYINWLSPIPRTSQIISSLKIGFALLFIIPLFVIIWGGINYWNSDIVKSVVVFCLGCVFVEFSDFYRSSIFDTPEIRNKRKLQKDHFPTPSTTIYYIKAWVFTVLLSVSAFFWKLIWLTLKFYIPCIFK